VALEPAELTAWADARLLRSRFALLRGRAVVEGRAGLAPLDSVSLVGVGQRFNGKALISAVTQRLNRDGWRTELRLGLSPEWFAQRPDIAATASGGLLPPVSQLQIAVVAGFEKDPSGEHRVKIQLPALDQKQGALWARLARPDAGKDRGIVFWPEAGDEVVVGFLDGDPRQPVVLGSLHGSARAPKAPAALPSDANDVRAIVSRAGSSVVFDDNDKVITIQTPAKNEVRIDDKAKAITVSDQHGNQIILNDKGITLKSAKDFTLDASAGKVAIRAKSVDLQ
jgi:Rhs element Vgr protein